MFVNKIIKDIQPYKLSSHKAWDFEYVQDVLKLDWNEASINPSPKVILAINDFIEKGKLNWYPNTNNLELIRELSKYNDVSEENVQYFSSSDSAHEYICKTFVDVNDKVAIIAPTYDNFRVSVESLGGKIEYFYLEEDFSLDFEKLRHFLNNQEIKIVYICNPNNPTGTSYSEEQLLNLIKEYSNKMFIVDEAYFEFNKITMKKYVKTYSNFIVSRTFSKAFALASFRIGYIITEKENLEHINKIRNAKNINMLSQIAAIAALKDKEYMLAYVDEVNEAKEEFIEVLHKISSIEVIGKMGGNYILLKIKNNLKEELLNYLEKNNIFVRNYSHIKMFEECIRISIGTKKQMKEVEEKILLFFERTENDK